MKIRILSDLHLECLAFQIPPLEDDSNTVLEGREALLSRAAKHYTHTLDDGPLIKRLFSIANDFFGDDTQSFNRAVRDILGFDGVIERFDNKNHYVAFFPEQIEIIERWPIQVAHQKISGTSEAPGKPTFPRPKL